MATTLTLTSGYETLNLNDGTNYALLPGYVPPVAMLRPASLGNRSIFRDTTSVIPLRIMGSTAPICLANAQALARALNRINLWRRGEDIDPYVLAHQPTGSSLPSALQVLCTAAGDASRLIALPPTFNKNIQAYEINPVTISIQHRGAWLGATQSGTAAAADNPSVLTVDLSEELNAPGPTKIQLTGIAASTSLIDDAYIIVTDTDPSSTYGDNVARYLAADMTSSEFSSTADAGNSAVGTNVMQIDASGDQTGTLTVADVDAEATNIFIFASLRNNHASTTWKIRAKTTGYVTNTGRWRHVATKSNEPFYMPLGMLTSHAGTHNDIALEVETTASVGTLDVNVIAVVPLGAGTHIIGLYGDTYDSAAYARVLTVNPRALTDTTPLVGVEVE